MDSDKLINLLNNYKESIIINRLKYRELNPDIAKDYRTFRIISSYDTKKTFLGDEDMFNGINYYLNLGIYLDKELIGYLGYRFSHPKDKSRYVPALIIKEKYQNIGIGDIVIKQLINSLFTEYYDVKSIYVTILEDNIASRKIVEKNNFRKFPGYKCNNECIVNGEKHKMIQYLYTFRDYEKDKEKLKKYKTLKLI